MVDILPLQFLLVMWAGWVNRRQLDVIAYLRVENQLLKAQLGRRRLRLTNDQRRRLAAKGHCLGRRVLREVATIVTPDTILRWHRQLIARKWTHEQRRVGRPGILKEIEQLTVGMAHDNARWGYTRIQGALRNVGHRVARSTIARILKGHGIEPAPERPTSLCAKTQPPRLRGLAIVELEHAVESLPASYRACFDQRGLGRVSSLPKPWCGGSS
jgi:hypothetical protein